MTPQKAALVIGSSRGIGRQIALTLAKNNYAVVVASKTEQTSSTLPGSIHSVAEEIRAAGGTAIPVRCDCRDENDVGKAVNIAIERFFKGKTPYSISKVGMTILAKGMANELKGTGVSISTLWPATVIKAHVTDVMNVPNSHMRTPDIFADAVLGIVNESTDKLNGAVLLDEDYLRSEGQTDFTKYQCEPGVEPPRMMPRVLPDLSVEEENENLGIINRDSKL